MEPPLLTDRQFEILKKMADGYTRLEIATALNLSPETIKSHSKTVLSKFGANTLREAYSEIHNYIKYFSLGQSTGRHYLAKVRRTITIGKDYNSAHIQHNASGFVVRGVVSELKVRFRSPLGPRDVVINGVPPTRTEFSGEIRTFSLDVDPPLQQGASFVRNASYVYSEPPGIRATFAAEHIVCPVGELSIVAKFPSDPPKNIRFSVINEQGSIDMLERHPECTFEIGRISKITVKSPEYGSRYMIHWDPVMLPQ